MTCAMALPCLWAGAGGLCSQREQNLCQTSIVALFCLKGTSGTRLDLHHLWEVHCPQRPSVWGRVCLHGVPRLQLW